VRCSAKFEVLDRMLRKLERCGHKTLIFCQMTRLMDLLGDFFELRRHLYLRLDGGYI